MPADLLAGLLGQVGRLQRQVLAPRGRGSPGEATARSRCSGQVAEGLDTGEIARQLAFGGGRSGVHDVTTRHCATGRAQAHEPGC
jgi:hypothetical protein